MKNLSTHITESFVKESKSNEDEFFDCAEVYLKANEGDLGGQAQGIANKLRSKYEYDSSKDSNDIFDDMYANYSSHKFISDIKDKLGKYFED